ncbi:MAG: ACP S-malonyltransferase [Ostreibacterium sp.]
MTQKIAIVFPGQGSQSIGMTAELYEQFSIVRETYVEASEVLGFDLWHLIANGSVEDLNQTVNTQPAMLAAGVACFRVLQTQLEVTPTYFAGHSLGEYTALVASGQLAFSEALGLARKRAEAMQIAVPVGVGAMAAILDLEAAVINQICVENSTAVVKVWIANDNAPGQIVIAGHQLAVKSACEALIQSGAKRAILLPVSVPSHCPLMQSAAEKMKKAFMMSSWSSGSVPVIHNWDVSPHTQTDEIITALTEQLVKPVRWVETIQYFADNGVDKVVEVGPGKVLAGLNKRIVKTIVAKPLFDRASLAQVVDFLKN